MPMPCDGTAPASPGRQAVIPLASCISVSESMPSRRSESSFAYFPFSFMMPKELSTIFSKICSLVPFFILRK